MPKKGSIKRQKYSTEAFLTPGFEMPSDYNDLVSLYRTVAKAADTRLERLEKLTQEENFKIADKWAYARAIRDIEEWSGEGVTRFNRKPPATKTLIEMKIEDIKTFLLRPSSTKAGIKQVYIKKAETINKNYGTDFKWNEVGTFFESESWKNIDSEFDSDTALKAVVKFRKYDRKSLEKAVKDANTSDLRLPDDQVGRIMKDIIKEKGNDLLDLLDLLDQ